MPGIIDTSGADSKIQELFNLLSEKTQRLILVKGARRLLRDMRVRVESKGLGTDGKAMPLYSPSYRLQRAKAGRTTDKRTLSFTAQMLGTRIVITGRGATVSIGWKPGKQAEKALSNERTVKRLGKPLGWVHPTKAETVSLIRLIRREVVTEAGKINC